MGYRAGPGALRALIYVDCRVVSRGQVGSVREVTDPRPRLTGDIARHVHITYFRFHFRFQTVRSGNAPLRRKSLKIRLQPQLLQLVIGHH